MYVYTCERDIRPRFDGVKIKFYYYYYLLSKSAVIQPQPDSSSRLNYHPTVTMQFLITNGVLSRPSTNSPRAMPMRFSSTDWVSSSQPPHVLPSLNLARTDGLPSMSRSVRMARTTVDRWRWPCKNSSSQSNPRMRSTSSHVLQHENDRELPHF